MFFCGIVVRQHVLVTFICFSVLTDIADHAAIVQGESPANKTTAENAVGVPQVFPNNSAESNGKQIFPGPKNLASNTCVSMLTKAVSNLVVTRNIEKNKSARIFAKVRDTYAQIVMNMTENLLAAINDIETAYNYSTFEQCLAMIDIPAPTAPEPEPEPSAAAQPQPKSPQHSLLVPVLLVVILTLFAYAAYLHQKLKTLSHPTVHIKYEKNPKLIGYHRQF